MPQMSPMCWLILMLYFIIMVMMMMLLIYFSFMKISCFNMDNINTKLMIWMW